MRSDWVISGCCHAAILLFGLVTLASSKPSEDATEFMPVAVVTDANVSQAPSGQHNAPKVNQPKPLADKVGDSKPVKRIAPKVSDKPEITTDAHAAPQPKPEVKPDPKPEAKAQPKPEPKPEEKPAPQIKPDQIAQELKKEQAKKPSKPEKKPPAFRPDKIAEELKKDEAKKAEEKQPKDVRQNAKFDANEVAALLDKRDPQRQLAAAQTLNSAGALGAANGHAAQLSQGELDALRARLSQCWSPPAGIDASTKISVVLHVVFKPDGSVAREPEVVEDPGTALGSALTESAKRALLLCQPFTMLKPEHYDLWKDIEVKFDPQEMLGG